MRHDRLLLQDILDAAVRPDRDDLAITFPRVSGYRVELPNDQLAAEYRDRSSAYKLRF